MAAQRASAASSANSDRALIAAPARPEPGGSEITDEDLAIFGHGDAIGMPHLTAATSRSPESVEKPADAIKFLDSVVVEIGNEDVAPASTATVAKQPEKEL